MTDIPRIVDGGAYWMIDQRCGSSGGHLIPLRKLARGNAIRLFGLELEP